MSSDDLLPDFKEIKWNVERIEAVLNRAPSWMLLVRAVRSWESPLLSIVFAACAIGIVLTAHVWQLPSPSLAAEFGSCRTRAWQLPNSEARQLSEMWNSRRLLFELGNRGI